MRVRSWPHAFPPYTFLRPETNCGRRVTFFQNVGKGQSEGRREPHRLRSIEKQGEGGGNHLPLNECEIYSFISFFNMFICSLPKHCEHLLCVLHYSSPGDTAVKRTSVAPTLRDTLSCLAFSCSLRPLPAGTGEGRGERPEADWETWPGAAAPRAVHCAQGPPPELSPLPGECPGEEYLKRTDGRDLS